jgi:hypothetical protein
VLKLEQPELRLELQSLSFVLSLVCLHVFWNDAYDDDGDASHFMQEINLFSNQQQLMFFKLIVQQKKVFLSF